MEGRGEGEGEFDEQKAGLLYVGPKMLPSRHLLTLFPIQDKNDFALNLTHLDIWE